MTTTPTPPAVLREWRQRRGYTQEEAARRAGLSQGQLSAIERGENTTLDTLRRLVEVYGVSADEAGAVLVGERAS